jgi:single-stranded-DNA-specific exonuclease
VARACGKPTIILSDNEEGRLKGSGRSFGACDLFAITQESRPLLEKFGGHAAAIGLSLDAVNLEAFRERLQQSFLERNYALDLRDPDILGELSFDVIDFTLSALLHRYEPFGQSNPVPKFISRGVEVRYAATMGKTQEHLRFLFAQEDIELQGVQFRSQEIPETGSLVDIVYTINENHFRGTTTLQLMVERIASPGEYL